MSNVLNFDDRRKVVSTIEKKSKAPLQLRYDYCNVEMSHVDIFFVTRVKYIGNNKSNTIQDVIISECLSNPFRYIKEFVMPGHQFKNIVYSGNETPEIKELIDKMLMEEFTSYEDNILDDEPSLPEFNERAAQLFVDYTIKDSGSLIYTKKKWFEGFRRNRKDIFNKVRELDHLENWVKFI